MLGTLTTRSREVEALRDRLELAESIMAELEATTDTLKYASPETASAARFEVVMAARRGVSHWNGEAA